MTTVLSCPSLQKVLHEGKMQEFHRGTPLVDRGIDFPYPLTCYNTVSAYLPSERSFWYRGLVLSWQHQIVFIEKVPLSKENPICVNLVLKGGSTKRDAPGTSKLYPPRS
jgi:hypothetical protein